MEQDRREFLKKGAIVGGAVWSAPAIATVGSAMATGSPACTCTQSALVAKTTGLLTLKVTGGNGQPCVVTVTAAALPQPTQVSGLCTTTATCTASAQMAEVPIFGLLSSTVFPSTASQAACASPPSCTTH